MLDIKFIREQPEKFDNLMKKRNLSPMSKIVNELDEEKRQLLTIMQQLQHAKNEKAKHIPKIQDKQSLEYKIAIKDASDIREKLAELDKKITENKKLEVFLDNMPNIPSHDVPCGLDETDNKFIKSFGEIREFSFEPKSHFEIGEKLKMIEFSQTVKISGSRFFTLNKQLAKLERALSNFMLDVHTNEYSYEEVHIPHLVKDHAMYNVGQLPKFDADSFKTSDDLRLIPTSEVFLTNLVSDTILKEDQLPMRLTAYSYCFRSEAGSAGKDTKGIIRTHQFSKVELVSITKPEESESEHQRMTNIAEEILKRLGLPYRIMLLCGGDMGFSSQKTYDLEVWLPAQKKYREISSCSNCGDFQARRMKAKYKSNKTKENIFVHTLNASALAVGRTIAAIIENYQNADGSITVPDCLVSYMGGLKKISN